MAVPRAERSVGYLKEKEWPNECMDVTQKCSSWTFQYMLKVQ